LLLEGDCVVSLKYKEGFVEEEVFPLVQGEVFTVEPPINHSFYSKNGAKILVLASETFKPEEPDTYRL
jgi:hypothetical protein